MAVTQEEVDRQLAKFGVYNKWIERAERGHLHELLNDGETVQALSGGFYEGQNWIIAVTEFRMIFLKEDLFGQLNKNILPLAEIKNIAGSVGFMFGRLDLQTIRGDRVIDMIEKKDVAPLVRRLTELLAAFR